MPAIDHYEILEKLGEGGMGVVWKARDTRLERVVALKLLPAAKTADPARRQRFVQEAGLSVSPDGRWLLYSQVDGAPGSDLMVVENFR